MSSRLAESSVKSEIWDEMKSVGDLTTSAGSGAVSTAVR